MWFVAVIQCLEGRYRALIDFRLTAEQEKIKAQAHAFAVREIRPAAPSVDDEEAFPRDIVEKAHRSGLTTLTFPKEFGGQGVTDPLVPLMMMEELAWGCAGINAAITSNYLPVEAILTLGTHKQKERLIPLLSDSSNLKLGAMALTEPEAGSNISNMKTRAVKKRDRYILNGRKKFVGNGGIADVHVVFAKVEDETDRDTIAPFVMENNEAPGFSIVKKDRKMGIRGTHTAEIQFDDVEIPLENRLGCQKDRKGLIRLLNHTRPFVSAAAVGLARAAFEYAFDYAENRIQFHQPIINHQGIGFLLAEMAAKIDAARYLTWKAGVEKNERNKSLESSKAKWYSSDVAMESTINAVQILGGNGYVKDHPVEKWMRDAKIFQIWEGTSEMQKLNIIRSLKKHK